MSHSHVLKDRDFSVLFVSRVFSVMALQAQAVMVGWYVYELSRDPLMLGMIGLAEAIPAIGFAFISGHIVDNRHPAQVYKWCLFTLVVNCLMIWATTIESLEISGHTRLIFLFASVFVSGMVRSFSSPSVFSLISFIVPRPSLPQAAALNSSAYQLAAIFGPAAGGLIYGFTSPGTAFLISPVLMTCALVSITAFSKKCKAMRSTAKAEPFLASIRSGIQFAYREKVLFSSMTLDMFSVLFGGAVAVLPMFSDQVLHAGSEGLGFLRSAPSVGSALMALFLGFHPLKVIAGQMLLWMVAGFGVCILGFAFSTHFVPAFLFLALSGAFDGVSMVIRGTILQMLTPEHLRGRISSLSLIFITSSNEIGAFESGLAARLMGLIPSLVFGGMMTLSVVGITAWASPELRRTRLNPHAAP